jgi:hypothetical protein
MWPSRTVFWTALRLTFLFTTTDYMIHIPIDFEDEELIAELDRNLWDFHNLVGNGVDDLYPRWFTE